MKKSKASPVYENIHLPTGASAHLECRSRTQIDSDHTPHFHEFAELIYFKNVNGVLNVNHTEVLLLPETVLYIPSNTIHSFSIEGYMDLILYQCSDEHLREQDLLNSFPKDPFCFTLEASLWERIHSLQEWYEHAMLNHRTFLAQNILKMITLFYWDIIDAHKSNNSAPKLNHDHNFFKPFIEHIDRQLDLSLDEAAKLCHVSRSHFSRKFKNYFSMSFSQYVEKRKIQHAIFLVMNSNLSITKIALKSGFHDSSYFCQIFKKHTQQTPTEMRQRSI